MPERFAWEKQVERFYGSPPQKSLDGADAVNGYYELLARSFAQGQLRLPVEPLPELLALKDPWLGTANWNVRLLDVALFNRNYYLYHGPTPVLLFFLPWYLVTGHDLPENFAAFLISLLAFTVLSRLFCEVLAKLEVRLPLALFALFLAALGIGQAVPFLLHRAKVYEVAIACGFLCVSLGFYCAFRSLNSPRRPAVWAVFSGLSFGLAVGCRPHLGLAAIAALFLFARRRFWRELIAYIAPLAVCGALLMAYNYARFHSPFEFGTRYLLGDDRYRNFGISAKNFTAGLYYLLLSPPRLEAEFPFVRLVLRDYALPPNYFLERIAGALTICPLILLAPLAPLVTKRNRAAANLLIAMLAFAIGCVLFIALVPFSSQRYAVDFLPALLFAGCLAAAALPRNIPATACVALVLLYSIFVNLGLAVQGPYDQFVQRDPRSYVALAHEVSPVLRFRPLLDPALRASGTFDLPVCPAQREPLLSAGELGSRYLLSVQCSGPGKIRLTSESALRGPGEPVEKELPFAPGSYKVSIEFTPKDRTMTVFWNENPVLRHPMTFLVTSRSQIRFGWDPTLGNLEKFPGHITPSTPDFGYLLK